MPAHNGNLEKLHKTSQNQITLKYAMAILFRGKKAKTLRVKLWQPGCPFPIFGLAKGEPAKAGQSQITLITSKA